MRLLHTSDWHLGRRLYNKTRHTEHALFLDWLLTTLQQQAVDVLLIAGDIFDTAAPSLTAQELYYTFLGRVAKSGCRHVVITAGNHDAAAFLNAPSSILKALQVWVVGAASSQKETEIHPETPCAALSEEVLVLHTADGEPELIVCATPYLRDSDVRRVSPGESLEDKEYKLSEGIRAHYAHVGQCAKHLQQKHHVPVVGMGHLFAAGGRVAEDEGIRELYVGSLQRVAATVFPKVFAYTALGHLHEAQKVNNRDDLRYSGAPLPMSFGEARHCKSVCLVDLEYESDVQVTLLPIPIFQHLIQVRGGRSAILREIEHLVEEQKQKTNTSVEAERLETKHRWLEILLEGTEPAGTLREELEEYIKESDLEILCIKDTRSRNQSLSSQEERPETLEELQPEDVFLRCLDAHHIAEEDRPELLAAFQEVLYEMYQSS